MALVLRYAARSDVGKSRSKNDDSAYAGQHLAVVADGMGGHAGGDVASASTVLDLIHLDRTGHEDPANVLADEIQTANSILSELVQTSPKLAGMGTTVTALLLHDGQLEFAHIGDSRAYRLKNGVFEQVSVDHTFVQRLIDEGRLRPEEADVHPHRNVLMRVLGDVDASPELDLASHPAEPGERWLLSSDGLDTVVPDHVIEDAMRYSDSLQDGVDRLVQLTLDGGAPDNVTVVMLEVAEATPEELAEAEALAAQADPEAEDREAEAAAASAGQAVEANNDGGGSPEDAAAPSPGSGEGPVAAVRADLIRRELATKPHVLVGAAALATQTGQIPIVTKHSTERRAAALLTHKAAPAEPTADEDAEDTPPVRRGWIVPTFLAVMSLLLVAVLWFGYLWTQTQYFVSQFDGRVAIYNGVSQDIGPIRLSRLDTAYNIPLQSLPLYQQQRLDSGIAARDLEHAETIVEELRITSRRNCPEPVPAATAAPSPSASAPAGATQSPQPTPTIPPECIGGTNE
ncbi:protein phosphatase 2C [Arthrobacter crystallopoietes BAB-32]|uniref:Protein phosphatase 2C n=1 Tax=Arthrobacter crystallopoietes BAB-32 TaxID=1246476 RepID=N1UYG1_9MICC|nr:protein phosphatase 2C domain-containing protein [Arthrobacter crystallopoietes]EMY35426.1 protein phosphatase 2C [Arthrobacter crystallopoietes BAB-32]